MTTRRPIPSFPRPKEDITDELLMGTNIPQFLGFCLQNDCMPLFGTRIFAERDKGNIAEYRRVVARLLLFVDGCEHEHSIGQSGRVNHSSNFQYAARVWSEVPDDRDLAAMNVAYLADPPSSFAVRSSSVRSSSSDSPPSQSPPRRSASPARPSSPRRRRRSFYDSPPRLPPSPARRHSFHQSPAPRTPPLPPPSRPPSPRPPTPPLPSAFFIHTATVEQSSRRRGQHYLRYHYIHPTTGVALCARLDSHPPDLVPAILVFWDSGRSSHVPLFREKALARYRHLLL
ncbi:hypothetical protein B9479_007919 [Cryptococcus floricola]|uniref:Uncharacterized protein n=1 Tax=Cryptococcus floricola TaxID=2591691 RepID=A0A5D3AMT2_9TREE|nr:hypothetical protein B9479_007919 [Cryptococcus floricola]